MPVSRLETYHHNCVRLGHDQQESLQLTNKDHQTGQKRAVQYKPAANFAEQPLYRWKRGSWKGVLLSNEKYLISDILTQCTSKFIRDQCVGILSLLHKMTHFPDICSNQYSVFIHATSKRKKPSNPRL